MKMLWMADRNPREKQPAQEVEQAVVEAAKAARMDMPLVKMGWRRETPDTVEIGPAQFFGAKPIWYWEVR